MIGAGLIAATVTMAQVPVGAPAGTTGLCKDGSYYNGATKKGACRGHKGVKDWYGDAAAPAATPAAVAPVTTVAPVQPAQRATPAKSNSTPLVNAAPGGGNGQVWVNTSSKTYHCPTDKWYGKTKSGAYMSEQDARAKGFHPDHGRACN